MRNLARKMPLPAKRLARRILALPGMASMKLGRIGSTSPLSEDWGYDHGRPIDRYYIEDFLARQAVDIKGRVLEVQEDNYCSRLGGARITQQDILNVDASNPRATIVGDLADPTTLPAGKFDCIVLTQTLHLVFDMEAAITNLHQALRPGGVLLITVPGITPLDREQFIDSWYWSLTEPALRRLLSGPFKPEKVALEAHGNLYAATSFLHAASVEQVSKRKLDMFDRRYPVTIAARAEA